MPRKNWHSLPEYQALRAMMEGNTTASAARRLGLSQSAVSRSLSNLESRVGSSLFERDSGRLSPTAAAVRLNARLDALFAALDDIDGPTETAVENLRLIAPPTFANNFLVSHMARFIKSHPECYTSLEISTSEDVISGIQQDQYDLGIISVELTRAGAKLIPFRRSVAACAMPVDHPLASKQLIEPADLHREPLIALSYRHARRAQLDKLLHESGAKPQMIAEVSTSAAAIDLVRLGVGIAIVSPFPSVQNGIENVVFRPFSSAISYQTYFAAPDHRPLSRSARHFMAQVRLHTAKDRFSTTV
ncbi:MAG: LysR substrate-binding domain-containing protein [Rhodobacterales bacterium]|nr:LysR substrate-binding domain-containing protein [Rhodobacterales bacterium]